MSDNNIVVIGGYSPMSSLSKWLFEYICTALARHFATVHPIAVHTLPPIDLLAGNTNNLEIKEALKLLQCTSTIVIITPIYQASYSGILKVFLDLLPQNAFQDKVILPLSISGSPGHMLAIEYSLNPVLMALGATHILHGVNIVRDAIYPSQGSFYVDTSTWNRVEKAIDSMVKEDDRMSRELVEIN